MPKGKILQKIKFLTQKRIYFAILPEKEAKFFSIAKFSH